MCCSGACSASIIEKASRSLIWKPFVIVGLNLVRFISDGSVRISCNRHSCRRHSPSCGHRHDVRGGRICCRDKSDDTTCAGVAENNSRRNSHSTARRKKDYQIQILCTVRHNSGGVCAGAGAGDSDGAPGLQWTLRAKCRQYRHWQCRLQQVSLKPRWHP